MDITTVEVAHEDARGTIADLIEGTDYAVTIVCSNRHAVRGNHFHAQTAQWAYVLSGRLRVHTGLEDTVVEAGQMVFNAPGEPHAWEALEDTVCIVFCRGVRVGRSYEDDTFRLSEPLIS